MILLESYNRLRHILSDRLPAGRYFYISRHAAFLTVMEDPELVKRFIDLSDHDDDPPGLLRQIYCLSPDKLLPWHGESAEEYVHMHHAQICISAQQFRENYQKYLDREGLSRKSCAMMDFVSEGTSQMMLEKHISFGLDGYYVGIPEYISGYSQNISYFLDRDLMDFSTFIKIEVYFTSMDPSLDHIDEQGRPVFAAESRDTRNLDKIADIHDQVRHYLNKYIYSLLDPDDVFDKDLVFELCRTVNNYAVDNLYYDDMADRRIETKT